MEETMRTETDEIRDNLKYLTLLSRDYPSQAAAASEIISTPMQVPMTTPTSVSAVRPLRRDRLVTASPIWSDIFIVALLQLGKCGGLLLFADHHNEPHKHQDKSSPD